MRQDGANVSSKAFLQLLRAGIWENDTCLLPYKEINFTEVFQDAQEQSVVGLISAGIEHVTNTIIPKDITLNFVGDILQVEQRNTEMNHYLQRIIERFNSEGIHFILCKRTRDSSML